MEQTAPLPSAPGSSGSAWGLHARAGKGILLPVKRRRKKLLITSILAVSLGIYYGNVKDAQLSFSIPIKVSPMGVWATLGDILMTPVMYLVSGTFQETPQRTHAWNVETFCPSSERIPAQFLLPVLGKENVSQRFVAGFPLFHIPILGGWRDYVVLQPKESKSGWYVGWITEEKTIQVSKIPLSGRVRLLQGSQETLFFGVDKETGDLILLECIGSGRIGEGGEHAHDILL